MRSIKIFKKGISLLILGVLALGEIQGEEHTVKKGSKEYNSVLNFAQRFINAYIEKQHIYSDNKDLKDLEHEFFDEETIVGPPGDQDTGIKIYIVNSFKIDEIIDEGDSYHVTVFFETSNKCNISMSKRIICQVYKKHEEVGLSIKKSGSNYKIKFVTIGGFLKENLLKKYASSARYSLQGI
ncbi:hypothetical protein [Leptospira stimsonii]|uniref:Uncharacterized protein n=1 Tax=Leptospira stimsonii TaxID=2202203 RepID=A0A8B3CJY6_9LEPT|nr:hypothetical protein [Leptospira stimsonii]RHX82836.1 hypothetical protein DLM78_23720 [Leptospira stimsonii]